MRSGGGTASRCDRLVPFQTRRYLSRTQAEADCNLTVFDDDAPQFACSWPMTSQKASHCTGGVRDHPAGGAAFNSPFELPTKERGPDDFPRRPPASLEIARSSRAVRARHPARTCSKSVARRFRRSGSLRFVQAELLRQARNRRARHAQAVVEARNAVAACRGRVRTWSSRDLYIFSIYEDGGCEYLPRVWGKSRDGQSVRWLRPGTAS